MTTERIYHSCSLQELLLKDDYLISTTGVFLGIPMIKDPDLPNPWNPLTNEQQYFLLKRIFYLNVDPGWVNNYTYQYATYFKLPGFPELVVKVKGNSFNYSIKDNAESLEEKTNYIRRVKGYSITKTVCLILEYVKIGRLALPTSRLLEEKYLAECRKSVKII